MKQEALPLDVAIVIDTREQLPYVFSGHRTVSKKLEAGDYSLEGFECRIAVERKSKEDAWGCVGGGRGRFERSLSRLAEIERPIVLIESSLDQFAIPPPYVQAITSKQAVHSYLSWEVRYNVHVAWAPSRAWAERMILVWFAKFLEHCR